MYKEMGTKNLNGWSRLGKKSLGTSDLCRVRSPLFSLVHVILVPCAGVYYETQLGASLRRMESNEMGLTAWRGLEPPAA